MTRNRGASQLTILQIATNAVFFASSCRSLILSPLVNRIFPRFSPRLEYEDAFGFVKLEKAQAR
jgi:hypothetical protein